MTTAEKRWRLSLYIAALLALLSFLVGYRILGLPEPDQLSAIATDMFAEYGYSVFFLAACLESVLVVGVYLPGTLVLFVGLAFVSQGLSGQLILAGIATWSGLISAAALNYAAGRYGWYKILVRAGLGSELEYHRTRFERAGVRWLAMSYYHPNVGALAMTAAGILGFEFLPCLAIVAAVAALWTLVFATLVAMAPSIAMLLLDLRLFLVLMAVGILVKIARLALPNRG